MDKYLYLQHPLRCFNIEPRSVEKSWFLTIVRLNNINEYEKIYIYSPSLHQALYQKLIKFFTNFIPLHIIPNILNEEDIDLFTLKIANDKDFYKSDKEIETYDSIEELKYPQEI